MELKIKNKNNQIWLVKKRKSLEIVLLKDRLDYVFTNFSSNFNSNGKFFLKKPAKNEEKIDYNNLFFENFSAQNSVLINLRELDKKTGDNFLIHPRRLQRV